MKMKARHRFEPALFGEGNDDDGLSQSVLRLTVDRLNVRFDLASLDVTLGRQAITFSQAYFWNPLDVF